jgi:O-antigen/teichoic acid export membrane protein
VTGLPRIVGMLRPLLRVGAATAVAAILGWLALVAVARILGAERYAEFSVLWGFYFAVGGLLFGMQQEVTRTVGSQEHPLVEPPPPPGSPVIAGVALVTVPGVLLLVVSAPWWASELFGDDPWPTVVATVVGLVTMAVQATIMGVVAARRQLGLFSGMVTVAAVARLLVIIAVCETTASTAGLMWGIASGSAIWLLFLPSTRIRHAIWAVGDAATVPFVARAASTMVASACAALLATGFPFMVRATSDGPLGAEAGALFAAVLATRAPLLLPLTGFQLVIIGYFVRHREHLPRALPKIVSLVLAVGVFAGLLATAIGPFLLKLLFGDDFVVEGRVLGLLAFAAALLVLLTVTGVALLALQRHVSSMFGWVLATVVAQAVLFLPLDLTHRSVVALCLGPTAGVLLHLSQLVRRSVDLAAVDEPEVTITPPA